MRRSYIFASLMSLSAVYAEAPFCGINTKAAADTNAIIELLQSKVLQETNAASPLKSEVQNEPLVERYMQYKGYAVIDGKGRLVIDLKLSPDGESIGKVIFEEHQAYRGIEVVKLGRDIAIFQDREGRRYELRPSDSRYVKVLVQAEKRDLYFETLDKLKRMTFDDYEDRIAGLQLSSALEEQERIGIEELEGGPDYSINRLVSSSGVEKDERGALVVSKGLEDCEHPLGRKQVKWELEGKKRELRLSNGPDNPLSEQAIENKIAEDSDRIFDDSAYVMHQCQTENGEAGVCCGNLCKKKIDFQEIAAEAQCGSGEDECGRRNEAYFEPFEGKACSGGSDEGTFHGKCVAGECQQCVSSNPCQGKVGDFKNGHCVYKTLPDGSLCAKGKVCVAENCVPFDNFLSLSRLKDNEALQAIVAGSLDPNEISKIASSLSLADSTSTCANITVLNGTSCIIRGGFGNCFDGQCAACSPASETKLAGAPPCPKSISWPDKKGVRLSCTYPDICVY